MRLNELSREQQRAFMILARQVVEADDRYALQEIEGLDLLEREMELPALSAGEPDAAGDLSLTFDTPKARALALLNLLLVGHADGALDERERALVRRAARDLDVDDDALATMEAWAGRHAALGREAEGFWREG